MWRVIPKLNQVILVIILAEFVFTVASGLITPFLSVFILEDIRGATVAVVGFATALYWVTKSLLQFPIARYLDRNHGEIDDYYSMLIGTGLVVAAVYAYYFASEVWHVFALQFLIAVGDAFIVPPFYAIFTRHIDSDSVGFEWALRSGFSIDTASAAVQARRGVSIEMARSMPTARVPVRIRLKLHIRPTRHTLFIVSSVTRPKRLEKRQKSGIMELERVRSKSGKSPR